MEKENKTEKAFSSIVCAISDNSYRLMTDGLNSENFVINDQI